MYVQCVYTESILDYIWICDLNRTEAAPFL